MREPATVASEAAHKSAGATPESAERFYLPELDVLRFFAFFGVFVWHIPIGGGAAYGSYGVLGSLGISGNFGVDLFFTLSGYLLTSLLLRERDQSGEINVRAFYIRRTLRIWPLYYFSLALAFLLSRIPASIASAPPYLPDLFAPIPLRSYFFMALFLLSFNFANSLLTTPPLFMNHLWTISVEEQFYVFWPWIVRYIPRRRIVVIPILMIVVACIARAISLPLNFHVPVWNNTFTRLDPIAVGILIALAPRLKPRPVFRLMLMLVGFASWIFASYYCELPLQVSTLKISMGYPAVALGSGAFLLAMLGTKSFGTRSLVARCLVYLGKISYGLYVYGPIARTVAVLLLFRGAIEGVLPKGWAPWTAWLAYVLIAFVTNVALAAVSYRLLEAPFLRLKERFTRVPSRAV
jgi:peptidoglycan/LPS O-acetylase OafA/YrhL